MGAIRQHCKKGESICKPLIINTMKKTNNPFRVLLACLLIAGGAAVLFEGATRVFGIIPVLATCTLSLPFLALWMYVVDGRIKDRERSRTDGIIRHEVRRQIRKGQ